MYTDLPKCLRCCFCLPLRYSLAVWGYLKLIASLVFLGILISALVSNVSSNHRSNGTITTLSIFISLISMDTIFDFVLIFAAHKKHVRLFQCYYYYSVLVLVLFAIMVVVSIGHQIFMMSYGFAHIYLVNMLIESILFSFGVILVQVYVTLLVRTEMIKLRDNCKFEFVNNAAESQCTINVGIDQQI